MPKLTGLPGTSEDKACVFVRSAHGAVEAIRNGYAASAAEDNGALSMWRDDSGQLRAELSRYCQTIESKSFRTLGELARWTRGALKRIKRNG